MRLADAVLPNSRAEADQLHRLLGVSTGRLFVVPNAVDCDDADSAGMHSTTPHRARSSFLKSCEIEDHVLYVGRIEPRKNVLGLIQACRDANVPLVVIGSAPPDQLEYIDRCRKAAAGSNVKFAGSLPKGDPRLATAMANARVFALPSWFETPGLAALEAAALSTPVVITSRGSTREYFGNDVHYCDPARPATIVAAISSAWKRPLESRAALAERIRRQWNWQETARITEAIYDAVAP